MPQFRTFRFLLLPLCAVAPILVRADEQSPALLDELVVTTTRIERPSKEVPQAIAVVGKEHIENKRMFNLKETLQEVPGVFVDTKNGGFDARLIVRGAGLKAPFAVREIAILRDGVPLTDPDSLTRLDFVDTMDIERVEIAKGPGNLFAAGSAGGAIQIFSKSVFDRSGDAVRGLVGNYGTVNAHLRRGMALDANEKHHATVSATYRKMDNDWRRWNEFETKTLSLKHGWLHDAGSWESELSYSETDVQLPGTMNAEQFTEFKRTGKQTDTDSNFKHTGRYSKVWFFNSRYEHEFGNWILRPRVYFNTWYHYHPVTSVINETADWVRNVGTDIEAFHRHDFAALGRGMLVLGFTVRQEKQPDSRKYQYADIDVITSGPQAGRIVRTRSDRKGALAEILSGDNWLYGMYFKESWRPNDRWIIDMGARYDWIDFDFKQTALWKYDFAQGKYVPGSGLQQYRKRYHLPAPQFGITYALTDTSNVWFSAAKASQVPADSEFTNNPSLTAAKATQYELGVKVRSRTLTLDASVYQIWVSDDIIQTVLEGNETKFVNAGKTDKKGLELQVSWRIDPQWSVGGYYGYADYRFDRFSEPVRQGAKVVNADRSGNRLPFIPRHQYGVFALWEHGSGWRVRLSSNTWGRYWLDAANTETYDGWRWVSNLAVAYRRGPHELQLFIDNLFDRRYAMEVKKDTAGRITYMAGQPRQIGVGYVYRF